MRKSNIQQLTLAAMVAAVYFVLCYFGNIFQLTFGPVSYTHLTLPTNSRV